VPVASGTDNAPVSFAGAPAGLAELVLDWLLAAKAVLLGVVEGLTEFLPVSSTGHLIVTEDVIRFRIATRDAFIVAIQAGAILAVCWEYRQRLIHFALNVLREAREQKLAANIAVGFLPAALVGVLAKSAIERFLFKPLPVASALVVGGLIILWAEARHKRRYGELDLAGRRRARVESLDDIRPWDAVRVGAMQCLALVPGTSRSGATIIGALLLGFSRKAATEFSFFLAIPTVIGASVYSGYKAREQFVAADLPLYAIGFVAAFAAALACVRWLLAYISQHDFRPFAWYRIVFGGVIWLTAYASWVDWTQ
jgi:undecaprenyl-diphosphatase